MPYLLNFFYLLLILLASPWLAYRAIRTGRYREGYAEKLLGRVPRRTSERTCLWLHAVSVGEVNLLAPLVREIRRQHPEWECVISTTTATGMALARKKYADLTVFYCPLDFTWAVAAAMRRVRPNILVLAELELWPNLVRAARRQGARVAVINGRLSEHSFRGYRRIRPFLRRLLAQIDLLAVQDETYAERFRALGARPETIQVTGSMKYDGAQTDRNNPATRRLAELAGLGPDDVVFLAGSTQEPEEAAALGVFRQLSPQWPNLRLILVPRHPERFEAVARLLDESGLPWRRRTGLTEKVESGEWRVESAERTEDSGQKREASGRGTVDGRTGAECENANPSTLHSLPSSVHSPLSTPHSPLSKIFLIDVVGELGAWWGTATIAFVGGSFGNRGGQNMIEPAAYGAAVSFGPNTRNFRDIVASMLAREAAVVVADEAELARFVRRCLEEPAYAEALGRWAQQLVREQLGATRKTVELLASI